jgi:catechol 2,3-dioxygenase-like lactoylglutathione lyase family enzyme
MQRLLCRVASFVLAVALALSPVHAQTGPALDSGWHEAVVSVRDFAPWETFLVEVVGWEVRARGVAPAGAAAHWGLPAETRIEEVLIANPNETRGWVRLVRFEGLAQEIIRGAAQPWDTGGIFSLMVRTQDAAGLYAAASARGWTAYNEPVDFSFGTSRLRNVILRGPDGVALGVYERLSPRIAPWPEGQVLAAPFNAMQIVRDIDAANDFYRNVLGFTQLSGGDYLNDRDEPNNFGLPINYATKIARGYGIYARADRQAGSVELMQFKGFAGRDLAARAQAPNLGILALRYAVADAQAYAALIERRGGRVQRSPGPLAVTPYGPVTLFHVTTPDGVRLEFFEPLTPARP